MKNNIILYSREIRSGKTSDLVEFYNKNKGNCDGFLTPDKEGWRQVHFLNTDEAIPFQLHDSSEESSIDIGRFRFSAEVFQMIRAQISKLYQSTKKYIIIDELGKLEMENFGFEPAFSRFLAEYKASTKNQILILVIRDSLLELAIDKYGFDKAIHCHSIEELNQFLA